MTSILVRTLAVQVAVLAFCAALAGCQSAPWPFIQTSTAQEAAETSFSEAEQHASQVPDKSENVADEQPSIALPVAGLASDRWIMNVWLAAHWTTPNVDEPKVRWRHLLLDDTIARSASRRPDLTQALANSNPVVAANTAIVMGRWRAGEPIPELISAIRNENLKLPLRQAAIETLGLISSDAATQAVDQMLAEADRERTDETRVTDVPEIHAELLHARSKHIDALADLRFTAALKSKSALVRLEAASAWARTQAPALDRTPAELLDLSSDSDTRVRIAAMRAAAANHHPRAVEVLSRATRDFDVNVRLAAIAGLGELGSEEAQRVLDKLRKDPSEIARAATVGALAALGANEAMIAAASDRSPRVRQAVAESLKELKADANQIQSDAKALARQLVQDSSSEVQRRAVESLRTWPLEQAGPALLLAMEQGTVLTRKEAAAQLAERWPAAKIFYTDAAPERRAEQLADLRRQWEREFDKLEDNVVQAVATEVASAAGISTEQFEFLERLATSDARERRLVIVELAKKLDGQRLTDASLERLAQLVENETDPLVWQAVLDLLAGDPRQVISRLAYVAVASTSSEVRRRACEYMQAHADPRHLAVLEPMLKDPNVTVAIAAVRAIGAAGVGDPEPLVHLLNSADKELRLESAIALSRSKVETGFAAIERLSRETDLEIRRAATVAMGEVGDPVFLPALMLLIEDRRDIQLAAMASLAKIAGCDVAATGDTSMLPDEKVRCWKRWYGERSDPRIHVGG